MRRRRVDPISLLFGTLFTVAAVIVLLGGSIVDDGHVLLPAGLIGLGVAMFIASRSGGVADVGSGEDSASDEVGAEGGEYGEVEQPGGSHDR